MRRTSSCFARRATLSTTSSSVSFASTASVRSTSKALTSTAWRSTKSSEAFLRCYTTTHVPKRRFKWLKRLGLVLVGTNALGAALLFSPTDRSLFYLGEKPSFEDEVERELHFKPSVVLPILIEFSFKYGFLKQGEQELLPDVEKLEALYPRSVLGSIIRFWMSIDTGKFTDAYNHLQNARNLATRYPDDNPKALLDYLLPPLSWDEQLKVGTFNATIPQEMTELRTGKIWAISSGFKPPNKVLSISLNSSLVKLKDGSLVIINPGSFDDNTVKSINALGKVAAIVTTAAGHADCLEAMSKVWPEAKLYGSDAATKHRKPDLNWTGFITDESNNPFAGELQNVHLNGHVFAENWFYHAETKSLLGLTDTAIITVPRKDSLDWGFRLYHLTLGGFRGSKTRTLGSQSYHHLFAHDRAAMKESVEKALQWDIELLVLGHGGVLSGPETKDTLRAGYTWLLDSSADSGKWDFWHNAFQWALMASLPKMLWSQLMTKKNSK